MFKSGLSKFCGRQSLNLLNPLLNSLSHMLQIVDDTANICPMKIKPPEKVKSVMRKEAMEQGQSDLSNPSGPSESDE